MLKSVGPALDDQVDEAQELEQGGHCRLRIPSRGDPYHAGAYIDSQQHQQHLNDVLKGLEAREETQRLACDFLLCDALLVSHS